MPLQNPRRSRLLTALLSSQLLLSGVPVTAGTVAAVTRQGHGVTLRIGRVREYGGKFRGTGTAVAGQVLRRSRNSL